MKLVSVDIETTGLDPKSDKILEIGMVIYDTETYKSTKPNEWDLKIFPAINVILLQDTESLVMSPEVKKMHEKLLENMRKVKDDNDPNYIDTDYHPERTGQLIYYCTPDNTERIITSFLQYHEVYYKSITAIGKNFGGFDKLFLDELFTDVHFKARYLDPVALYYDIYSDDRELGLPNLQRCLDIARNESRGYGLFKNNLDSIVSHRAVYDAFDTLKIVLWKYWINRHVLLTEFNMKPTISTFEFCKNKNLYKYLSEESFKRLDELNQKYDFLKVLANDETFLEYELPALIDEFNTFNEDMVDALYACSFPYIDDPFADDYPEEVYKKFRESFESKKPGQIVACGTDYRPYYKVNDSKVITFIYADKAGPMYSLDEITDARTLQDKRAKNWMTKEAVEKEYNITLETI